MFEIKNNEPLVATIQNFLTKNECDSLINIARDQLSLASNSDSRVKISISENHLASKIANQISQELKIDCSRFEDIEIYRYREHDTFERHVDFFKSPEQCIQGGNRVSTVILHLNSVKKGGETFFPWLRVHETAVRGKLLYFDYHYDEPEIKIKSEFTSMPIIDGEKWIAVLRIREYSITRILKNTKIPVDFYSRKFEDTVFELECGPSHNRRTLKVNLPANTVPNNTILVAFTGSIDSSLLLYILATLNNLQTMPYNLQPIVVNNLRGSLDDSENSFRYPIIEDWGKMPLMINLIREKANSGHILNLVTKVASNTVPRNKQIGEGLFSTYISQFTERFVKYEYIYSGSNESPPVGAIAPRPFSTQTPKFPWVMPFLNLQKSHIVDAIIQLNLEDFFKTTSICRRNHTSLDEHCNLFWQCNERRWAFKELNKVELGMHYLCNKGREK